MTRKLLLQILIGLAIALVAAVSCIGSFDVFRTLHPDAPWWLWLAGGR